MLQREILQSETFEGSRVRLLTSAATGMDWAFPIAFIRLFAGNYFYDHSADYMADLGDYPIDLQILGVYVGTK
jgi:hypothetical protein